MCVCMHVCVTTLYTVRVAPTIVMILDPYTWAYYVQ